MTYRVEIYNALIPFFNKAHEDGDEELNEEIGNLLDIIWRNMTEEERRSCP